MRLRLRAGLQPARRHLRHGEGKRGSLLVPARHLHLEQPALQTLAAVPLALFLLVARQADAGGGGEDPARTRP